MLYKCTFVIILSHSAPNPPFKSHILKLTIQSVVDKTRRAVLKGAGGTCLRLSYIGAILCPKCSFETPEGVPKRQTFNSAPGLKIKVLHRSTLKIRQLLLCNVRKLGTLFVKLNLFLLSFLKITIGKD